VPARTITNGLATATNNSNATIADSLINAFEIIVIPFIFAFIIW
jgi:hypothetical protein